MQFRPVGVEGPDEELMPEMADFGENTRLPVAAGCRGGEGCRTDGCHDAALPFFARGLRRLRNALFVTLKPSFGLIY
jgi:hypothetical protein